jgi:hypothetical protein
VLFVQAVVSFGLCLAAPEALLVDQMGTTARHCCSKVPAAIRHCIDPRKEGNWDPAAVVAYPLQVSDQVHIGTYVPTYPHP